jgi:DNA-binding HxlR family transcriptional regulator
VNAGTTMQDRIARLRAINDADAFKFTVEQLERRGLLEGVLDRAPDLRKRLREMLFEIWWSRWDAAEGEELEALKREILSWGESGRRLHQRLARRTLNELEEQGALESRIRPDGQREWRITELGKKIAERLDRGETVTVRGGEIIERRELDDHDEKEDE